MKFSAEEYWRAIILYGKTTSTYKMALAQCILNYSRDGIDKITLSDLSEDFLRIYQERLKKNKPQLNLQGRQTVVERKIKEMTVGRITRDEALDTIQKHSLYSMVLPKFHTVGTKPIPVKIYEFNEKVLSIKDGALKILSGNTNYEKLEEVLARWDLLESAFESINNIDPHYVNIELQYLQKGYPRKNITHVVGALRGYQQNKCFYCGEELYEPIHVDHVIPRTVVQHDEMWNLVLAHELCNEQKSDNLPSKMFIEKLIDRNEGLIQSNHPLKQTLIMELGKTKLRREFKIKLVYNHAKKKIKRYWRGDPDYDPQKDFFYRKLVQELKSR